MDFCEIVMYAINLGLKPYILIRHIPALNYYSDSWMGEVHLDLESYRINKPDQLNCPSCE
jgi:hypothetical protein